MKCTIENYRKRTLRFCCPQILPFTLATNSSPGPFGTNSRWKMISRYAGFSHLGSRSKGVSIKQETVVQWTIISSCPLFESGGFGTLHFHTEMASCPRGRGPAIHRFHMYDGLSISKTSSPLIIQVRGLCRKNIEHQITLFMNQCIKPVAISLLDESWNILSSSRWKRPSNSAI